MFLVFNKSRLRARKIQKKHLFVGDYFKKNKRSRLLSEASGSKHCVKWNMMLHLAHGFLGKSPMPMLRKCFNFSCNIAHFMLGFFLLSKAQNIKLPSLKYIFIICLDNNSFTLSNVLTKQRKSLN